VGLGPTGITQNGKTQKQF
jgi:hypothetical protein